MDTDSILVEREREKDRLGKAIDAFVEEMKARAFQKVDEGYMGWDTLEGWKPCRGPEDRLVLEAIEASQESTHPARKSRKCIDAANFACFGWALREWVPNNPREEPGNGE